MLLQTDGRWSHLQLGVIDEKVITIGDAGCLLVSLCNANCLVGNLLLPDTLLQELANVEGVTKEGNLLPPPRPSLHSRHPDRPRVVS